LHYYQSFQLNAKRASTEKYLKGIGSLSSSVAYNQGQVTLIFNTISCGLQSRMADNKEIQYMFFNRSQRV